MNVLERAIADNTDQVRFLKQFPPLIFVIFDQMAVFDNFDSNLRV